MDDLVEIRFKLPRSWRDALQESSDEMGFSLADLMRMISRGFLRNRYTQAEQEALG